MVGHEDAKLLQTVIFVWNPTQSDIQVDKIGLDFSCVVLGSNPKQILAHSGISIPVSVRLKKNFGLNPVKCHVIESTGAAGKMWTGKISKSGIAGKTAGELGKAARCKSFVSPVRVPQQGGQASRKRAISRRELR